jgi:hypothetical protein
MVGVVVFCFIPRLKPACLLLQILALMPVYTLLAARCGPGTFDCLGGWILGNPSRSSKHNIYRI